MANFVQSVIWMILSPLAVFTDVLAIMIISHYRPFYHGTDVVLISLHVAMATNAFFLLPIPAVLEFMGFEWPFELCQFYVWTFITCKIAQMINLVTIGLHWITVLKTSSHTKTRTSATAVKVITFFTWLLAGSLGVLPIIGINEKDYHSVESCKFLAFDLGIGFAIFFMIFNIATMCTSVVCATDATVLLRHMLRAGKGKIKTDGYQTPNKLADIATTDVQISHFVYDKHHQLTFAEDLCRFVLITVIVSFCINHLPYAIMEFLQVVQSTDGETLEFVVLWLLLLEALLSPHLLWLFSKRYRHALVYGWKVHVLRDKSAVEEDPFSCTLQAYTRRVRDSQGNSVRVTRRLRPMEIMTITTDKEVQANEEDVSSLVGRTVQIHDNSAHYKQNGILYSVGAEGYIHDEPIVRHNVERTTPAKSSASTPIKRSNATPVRDLHRTSSGHSRTEWKEQMRKKHLPPIFVNEAFDSEEVASKPVAPVETQMYQKQGEMGSTNSMYYYMSSDYHPDYLTDSLSRDKQRQAETDSEGVSGSYEEKDIAVILDSNEEPAETNAHALQDTLVEQEYVTHSGFPYGESDSHEDQTGDILTVSNDGNVLQDDDIETGKDSEKSCSSDDKRSEQSSPQPISNDSSFIEHVSVETPVFSHTTKRNYIFAENESDNSDTSITFRPVKEERMRPIWMDEMESDSNEDTPTVTKDEPVYNHLDESNTSSINQRLLSASLDERSSQCSTPGSVVFDEEIDRGFEEALAFGNTTSTYNYAGVGLCFESIKEEPEGSPKSARNPFKRLESTESFETKAVISSADTDSSTNENENPFDNVPIKTPMYRSINYSNNIPLRTTDYMMREEEEKELIDSGFTSGADIGMTTHAPRDHPWPEMYGGLQEESDLSFESDFSSAHLEENVKTGPDPGNKIDNQRKLDKKHLVVGDFHFSFPDAHMDVKSAYF